MHRSVEPANIQFFEKQKRWLLADFSKWARRGTESPVVFSLRHAAPEVGVHVLSYCAFPPATSRGLVDTGSMHTSRALSQHQRGVVCYWAGVTFQLGLNRHHLPVVDHSCCLGRHDAR